MGITPKFIDRARIFVRAGHGGDGHVGFRREKFVPRGGPDGGDGGRGGHVIFVASPHLATLLDFQYRRHFTAENGQAGGGKQKTGAGGKDLTIEVPLGTVVLDDQAKEVIGELMQAGEPLVVAQGGKGGLGNIHFTSSTQQAPRSCTPGETGEEKWIRVELHLIADIGIVGPPNAGKSTLLSHLTAAHPKIAAYPFTTLSPALGVLELNEKKVALADIPGLIEGAHQGAGLGFDFLRHIKRTRALLFLLEGAADPEKPWEDFQVTRNEIAQYDIHLTQRPSAVAINKTDLLTDLASQEIKKRFAQEKIQVISISAVKQTGLDELKVKLATLI